MRLLPVTFSGRFRAYIKEARGLQDAPDQALLQRARVEMDRWLPAAEQTDPAPVYFYDTWQRSGSGCPKWSLSVLTGPESAAFRRQAPEHPCDQIRALDANETAYRLYNAGPERLAYFELGDDWQALGDQAGVSSPWRDG